MHPQILCNALAVIGIVALGVAAKFGPPGTGDQIALAAVSSLGGFIGGVSAAHAAMRLAAPPDPAPGPAPAIPPQAIPPQP
jgi:hypothetical protein